MDAKLTDKQLEDIELIKDILLDVSDDGFDNIHYAYDNGIKSGYYYRPKDTLLIFIGILPHHDDKTIYHQFLYPNSIIDCLKRLRSLFNVSIDFMIDHHWYDEKRFIVGIDYGDIKIQSIRLSIDL
jgi:hypothetical protein